MASGVGRRLISKLELFDMSNHSKALVKLESWAYNSPEIKYHGNSIDIGLMAEALIYYDQILVNITNQPQLAEFINWFVKQKKYNDLLSLFEDETLKLYDYSFATAAFFDPRSNSYTLANMQDPLQGEPNTFEQRFLYHESLDQCFKNATERKKLYKAVRGRVIEVKAKDFGLAIENAKEDFADPKRNELLLQSLVDEVYPRLGLGTPPKIEAKVEAADGKNIVTYNIDFDKLKYLLGTNLNFHKGTPLTGIAHCNRLIWSAVQERCDLYLGSPMASLVGDKLYEINSKKIKLKENIEQLHEEVEFPDIRKLVNEGRIGLSEILHIRKKARRFRDWLQNESDRDRNAIIAYHMETAKEAGIISFGRKSLRMFGILGVPFITAYVAQSHPNTDIASSVVGAGAAYILDAASKLGEDWKPVVFGNWVSERIKKLIGDE